MFTSTKPEHVLSYSLAWVCAGVPLVRADTVKLNLDLADPGPFLPGVGGFIDFSIFVELLDTEADGIDTQGLHGVRYDIVLHAGGNPLGLITAAQTGEFRHNGNAALVSDERFEPTFGEEELFAGGFGFTIDPPASPSPDHDGINDQAVHLDFFWAADVEPNVPGLQPWALAGVGYGERPAGGVWTVIRSQFPIPAEPGVYTVDLVNNASTVIRPDVDLTQDHNDMTMWTQILPSDKRLGDIFTYTVLPEPASVVLLLAGWAIPRRRVV